VYTYYNLQKKKTPLAAEHMIGLLDRTQELGLMIGRGGIAGNVIRLKPPMCITRADVDFAVAVLRIALGELEARMKRK
jgi:alanine-glyoxylate transaminase / (R)-3-amino-2-methylpropionate-pyruvate transaminase